MCTLGRNEGETAAYIENNTSLRDMLGKVKSRVSVLKDRGRVGGHNHYLRIEGIGIHGKMKNLLFSRNE